MAKQVTWSGTIVLDVLTDEEATAAQVREALEAELDALNIEYDDAVYRVVDVIRKGEGG